MAHVDVLWSDALTPDKVLQFIFAVLAVILNGVLLASMYKGRRKIFVTRIAYIVANLAFADCLNGLFLIIFSQPIKQLDFADGNESHSKLSLPFMWAAFCASFFTLFLMAFERIVIITLPMAWSRLLTIPRTLICITFVWALSIGAGVTLRINREYAQFYLCLIVEFCALYFVASHVYILWLLRKRERQRKSIIEMTVHQDSSQTTPCLSPKVTGDTSHIAHKKVTIVVTILLLVMIITCVPHFVALQMFAVNNTYDKKLDRKINIDIYIIVRYYSDAFLYVNFLANPIIYAWRLRIYRNAFYSLLGRSSSN